ncbi:DUF2516 family protein [Actinomadura atramentaria]|uniref:DUF2516 family protein n=1 Tax=Actinomadura atramentaria TaxID=1990 RepID=UPI001F0B0D50|nr:DUF2516 family protein [Actinomadura atramentaria]
MTGLNVLEYFFWLLLLIAFVMEAFALVDSLTVPAGAYAAASKQSKKLWTILLSVASVIGLACVALPAQGASPISLTLGILPVAAFIASAVYLADVRPAVKPFKRRRGGGGSYGSW